MIRVSDKNNLLIELFDSYRDTITRSLPEDSQIEVLGTWDVDVDASHKPTVVVCTEPNADRAHRVFAQLLDRRPNSLWAVNHEKAGHVWQVPQSVFFASNLCLTVRANPESQRWQANLKPYLASALLGGWGVERLYLFHWIKRYGLLDQCLVNFRRRNISNVAPEHAEWYVDYQSPEIAVLDDPRFQTTAYEQGGINTMRPVTFERLDCTFISQIVPWQIYDRSWLNIVAETCYDSFLPSEKIGKPLLAGQPWVVFACAGFLERVRALGFQTFSPWIDESYDSIQNVRDRAQAVVASVIEFRDRTDSEKLKIVQDMQPVLDHNRALMLNTRHWYDPLVRAMGDLVK